MEKVIDGHRQCPAGNLSNHLMLLMAFRAPSQCPGELVLVLCEHSGSFYCSSETLEPLKKEGLCYHSELSSISPSYESRNAKFKIVMQSRERIQSVFQRLHTLCQLLRQKQVLFINSQV